MSLHPQPFTAVPPETARVARAAFPQGNLYMHMREELDHVQHIGIGTALSPRGELAMPIDVCRDVLLLSRQLTSSAPMHTRNRPKTQNVFQNDEHL